MQQQQKKKEERREKIERTRAIGCDRTEKRQKLFEINFAPKTRTTRNINENSFINFEPSRLCTVSQLNRLHVALNVQYTA